MKYQHLASEPFNEDKAKEIAHDMHLFAHDRKIVGSLMVTLGQHGAIHYYRNNGKSKSWIHLKEEVKSNIQDFLKERNQDTKSAGDKFTAGAINALQKSKSLEEAVMIGSKFAIENVLKYPNISEQDFEIDFFSQKNRRHYHSDGRPRKTNRIPLSSKEEVVTSM